MPGARVPSTRDLAQQLGISRPIVVDAYAQLAAEGYLMLRQGSHPRIASSVPAVATPTHADAEAMRPPRYDLRPAVPDLSSFPRAAWLRATRNALARMTDDDLGYSDPHGSGALRRALVEYLGRVRGVVADPEQVIVTSGYAQGRALACLALRSAHAQRIAVEDPGYSEWDAVTRAGLERVPIAVDDLGIDTDALAQSNADAVMVTPSHQFPTGVVLSGERRTALLAWLRARDAIAIEDDYDAEFRYDRAPVGALQGLGPEHVIYAGTTSKTLAPALRLGWLVVPRRLLESVRHEHRLADFGCPRIEQHALAEFISSGELDRHLRRMRPRYRARRDSMIDAIRTEMPDARVQGISAGLHVTVLLSDSDDERAIRDEARRRGIALEIVAEHRLVERSGGAALLLGYGRSHEATIRAGVRELAAVIRATRRVGR